MEKNGVLERNGSAPRFSAEQIEAARQREQDEAARKAVESQELARYLVEHEAQGAQLEAGDDIVHVEGYSGPLSNAPALSTSPKPIHNADALWVEKVKPGEKGHFLIYSPVFYGVHTHYRGEGRGTVLCFADRSLCVGGHDESSLRWHGFLHAFHIEGMRQVFVHFTPEGAKLLLSQLDDGTSLRGMRVQIRRSTAKKGPFYVQLLGQSEVGERKLPKHRDPRASIFKLFKITPSGKMLHSAFSGGEDFPTAEG